MPGGILLDLLLKVATPLLSRAAKGSLRALLQQPPVSKAIDATATVFPELPALGHTLSAWCQSDDFRRILDDVKDGSRDLSEDRVIDSFVEIGGFFAGGDTRALAEQVLNAFVLKLEEQLYSTDQGRFLLARREEVLHETTHERLEQLDALLISVQGEFRQLEQRLPAPEDQSASPTGQEQVWNAKVDTARDLLNQGRARAARLMLEALRRELASESPSQDIQFRIRTNLGACALQLGEIDGASKEYVAALTHRPNSPVALANAAIGKLLLNHPQDALGLVRRARELAHRDAHVTAVHLRALHEAGRAAELEDLVRAEPWISKEAGCAFALAHIRCQQARYEEAELHARDALRGGPNDAQAYLLLAQAIIIPAQREIQDDTPLSWRLPSALRARLVEAETALDSAVGLLEDHDNRGLFHEALVNRAAVRAMLGNFDDALRDCDRVLSRDPSNARALRNRALLLLRLDRTLDAIHELERLPLEEDLDLLLAKAYVAEDVPEKAIGLLLPNFQSAARDRRHLEIAEILLAAYGRAGNEIEADKLARSVAETWASDAEALAIVARHRRQQKRIDDAIALLCEALAYASGHHRDRIALDLADTYNAAGRYSEAAELYGQVVDRTTDHPFTRRYLVALYNAGLDRDALVLARTLRGDQRVIPVVTEVEAAVLERMGDLDGAIDLRGQLSEVEPRNISHRVHVALLQLRRGAGDAARATLEGIRVDDLTHSHALLQVAQARATLGMPGVLPFAYRARRLDFGNPSVHLGYVGLFLNREGPDQDLLEVDRVAADCTVHLRSGDRSQTVTIVDDPEPNRERGEFLPSDPLPQKLLGLTKGSRVTLRQGPLEELSYDVVDVQSKYVFAFQETLTKFSTWFPAHAALQRIEISEHDISKVLMTLDTRHRHTSQVMALYRERNLTLGAFARLVGTSVMDVWAGLVNRPDGGILVSGGEPHDGERDGSIVASANTVVLDLTAVLTLAYLGLLDILPQRFDRLLVSQGLLDDIAEAMVGRVAGPGPAMTMWKEGEQYFRRELDPEDVERHQGFLEGIRIFVHTKCIVKPTMAALDLGRGGLSHLEELLGRSAVGALLLAKEHGSPLYADDLGLRAIARNDWQASSFWTQTLLVDLRTRATITDDQYHEAVQKLIVGGYRFVSIASEGLLWTLRVANFTPSAVVTRVLEALHGPECSEESAASVLADLVKRVWLEPLLYHQKVLFLDLVLTTLTTGRNYDRVLNRLRIALREHFMLLPTVLPLILQSIELWSQQRRLRGGLVRLE